MNIDELKKMIDSSLEAVRSEGWKIEPYTWVSTKGCCCPLGACMIVAGPCPPLEDISDCVRALGLTTDQGYSFADGFDGRPYNQLEARHIFEFWKLGRSYRDKLIREKAFDPLTNSLNNTEEL